MYSSGSDENGNSHRNGVGIFISTEVTKYVRNFVLISDRIMLLQLNTSLFNTNIKQIYAPTADKRYDTEVQVFYQKLEKVLKSLKSNEIIYIMSDFNAKLAKAVEPTWLAYTD